MRRSARDAKNLGKIAIFFFVTGIVAWTFRATTIALLLTAVAAVFALKCLVHLFAYLANKRALSRGTERVEEMPDEDEPVPDEVSHDIDLGSGYGVIKVAYGRKVYETRRQCVETILNSVVEQRQRFLHEYLKFLADCREEYVEEAEEISTLKIQRIQIFRLQDQCIAFVYFSGEAGQNWYAKYDGARFTEIVQI